LFSQFHNFKLEADLQTYLSNDTVLPFWLVSNQYGKIPNHSSVQFLELGFSSSDNSLLKELTLDYGLDLLYTYAGKSDLKLQEYFLRLKYKPFSLRIGAIEDSTWYNGLSSTNGNILYSTNFRPLPGIEFSSTDWIAIPYTREYVKIKMLYSESLTHDTRYVNGARINRKYAYGLFGGDLPVNFYLGLNHFVQWGGASRDTSVKDLNPGSVVDYLKTIFPTSGVDSSNPNDLLNARGNHIGNYDFGFMINTHTLHITIYHQTIAEDNSGMQLENWRDGITGIYLERTDPGIFNSFIYEFTYTMHQSGDKHGEIDGVFYRGRDNYFNNTIYHSGWTNFGRMIGSPLFTVGPFSKEGYVTGINNNRFISHNLGLFGTINDDTQYRVLLMQSKNHGTYSNPFVKVISCTSMKILLRHPLKLVPEILVSAGLSGDVYNDSQTRWGCFLGINYCLKNH